MIGILRKIFGLSPKPSRSTPTTEELKNDLKWWEEQKEKIEKRHAKGDYLERIPSLNQCTQVIGDIHKELARCGED